MRQGRMLPVTALLLVRPLARISFIPLGIEYSTLDVSTLAPNPSPGMVEGMRDVKDTARALVRLSYDGRVFKTFRGPKAEERFDNEVLVLRHLEERGCTFVPRLLEADREQLRIVTSNCGSRVEHLDEERIPELFAQLLPFGVRHDDADKRNVTYRQSDGRFCLIDFEFATILPQNETPSHGTTQ